MNSNNLSEAIIQEVRKEIARRSFWEFCLYFDNEFFSKRIFLKRIADGFQKIYDKEIKSLSVSMPPRAGKSYITTLYAAWYLANKPELSVMRNTCTTTLYDKFSYDTRAIIKSDKFKEVFPNIKLTGDRQNISGWNLEQSRQVGYFGSGVGGTIIGFGASGLAITDDLYKSLQDALSSTVNDSVHRWKQSAHDSRLEKNCPVIDIGTRWTKQDVIGANMESGKYELSIVIPALNEDGTSFCEDVKSTDEYIKIRNEVAPEIWAGEYMQQPVEMEGILFHKEDLNRFKLNELTQIPESVLGYIDVADEGNDYFSFPIGKIYKGKVFITDVIFSRDNIDITLPKAIGLFKDNKLDYVRVESNNQGSAFIKMMRNHVMSDRVLGVANTANKHTRILMEYGFIKNHLYFLDESEYRQGSDYDQFMRQMLGYMKDGSSKHDDAIDSISGLSKFISSFLPHLFNN